MELTFKAENLSISIVSHGHGQLIKDLLWDLQPLMQGGVQVLLTLNIPEDEQFLHNLPFQPELIRNIYAKGFGENHNDAFLRVKRPWFAVINPDIRLESELFQSLVAACSGKRLGVVAPRITNSRGQIEDSARYYPTPTRIARRIVNRWLGLKTNFDYDVSGSNLLQVDWISGCFMLFDARAYNLINGFDSRFFMYLEDADICHRLHLAGFEVLISTWESVLHKAQYASRSNWRYFIWHVKSMARFLWNNRII